jgi:hypothetical protein
MGKPAQLCFNMLPILLVVIQLKYIHFHYIIHKSYQVHLPAAATMSEDLDPMLAGLPETNISEE